MLDREMNRGALSWISCPRTREEIGAYLHLQTADWCGGGEVAEIHRDGTIHHYRYRYKPGGHDFLLEEFLSLPVEATTELKALLRALPLKEQDQSLAESRSGMSASPPAFSGGVSEAEAVSAWLSKSAAITWLPQRSRTVTCEPADPPSHLTVFKWYLQP
jgi:hypothetical protein